MLTFKQKIEKIILYPLKLLPVKKNRISFICYNCTQYSCNPKYISEYIQKNLENTYELIWYYSNDDVRHLLPEYVKKVRKNSLSYFVSLMTSEIIISNVTLPRIIPWKKKQIKINTWHGTAFKGDNNKYGNDYNQFQFFLAENKLTKNIYRKKDSFNYQGKIIEIGMPRNDILITQNSDLKNTVYQNLGIPKEKKIIMYAPTFRENIIDNPFNIDFDVLIKELEKKFGGEWIVLFRYHHMQAGRTECKNSVDVTSFPDMQQLLLIADILITDYSSTMWDFSLMNKPVFLYAPDIEHYVKHERGAFYWPLDRLPFAIAKKNSELLLAIQNYDEKEYLKRVKKYHEELGRYNYKGDSTEKFVKLFLKGRKRL